MVNPHWLEAAYRLTTSLLCTARPQPARLGAKPAVIDTRCGCTYCPQLSKMSSLSSGVDLSLDNIRGKAMKCESSKMFIVVDDRHFVQTFQCAKRTLNLREGLEEELLLHWTALS
ncbi:hypothetical protein AAFF_G00181100 [Aldrovandia affinis]|uniref:Uncharacterized protein n=1 Tax=Aldrovandia affinis TaxID=143900 RepID=A0AAD7WW08_9TELE|nr:hypothetical protein AAFF_G00181100 [Aldrovandia affinis]